VPARVAGVGMFVMVAEPADGVVRNLADAAGSGVKVINPVSTEFVSRAAGASPALQPLMKLMKMINVSM
jgi:hypothetical protein